MSINQEASRDVSICSNHMCQAKVSSKIRTLFGAIIIGQWLWSSWQSGRFWHQRTRVQIQSSAIFIKDLFTVRCYDKRTNKEKESGKRPFKKQQGSGCDSVGRAVASNTRGPRFESSHQQFILRTYLLLTVKKRGQIKKKSPGKDYLKNNKAVVVAQLVETSLPTPEHQGSNPVITKIYIQYCRLYWKDENKEKEARKDHLKTIGLLSYLKPLRELIRHLLVRLLQLLVLHEEGLAKLGRQDQVLLLLYQLHSEVVLVGLFGDRIDSRGERRRRVRQKRVVVVAAGCGLRKVAAVPPFGRTLAPENC